MPVFILWCGFLGGWLLVAGPVYQAALELGEEEFRREDFEAMSKRYVPPPAVSPWWWLLPPVGYVLHRRRTQRMRREMMALWTPEQLQVFVHISNKATGWILVAGGAVLIALNETWHLVEHYAWPVAVFWGLAAFMALLSAAHTTARLHMTSGILTEGPPASAR